MKRVYVVHNAFGLLLALFHRACQYDKCIVIARKDALSLYDEYCHLFGESKVLIFSGTCPGLKVVHAFFSSKEVWISSAWHPRMVVIWPILNAIRASVSIFDEGVATINEKFYESINKGRSRFYKLWLGMNLSRVRPCLYSIFDYRDVSDDFIRSCKVSKVFEFDLDKTHVKRFQPRDGEIDAGDSPKKIILILGGIDIDGSSLLSALEKKGLISHRFEVMVRDHPLALRRDDIFGTPESFVMKNIGAIDSIFGVGSSSLVLIKKIFPSIPVYTVSCVDKKSRLGKFERYGIASITI